MWPKKPRKNMWSNGSAMLIQHNKLQKSQEDDKNCQENINIRPVKSKVCAYKKCQATKCYKKISDKWPVKPQMDMWSKEPAKQPGQELSSYNKL